VNVAGRTVLLTGATGGLGQAIARRLHGAGAQLVLTGRRGEVLDELAAEIGALTVAVDLADPVAVDGLAEACAQVDVLVANAGLPGSGHLLSFDVEEIDRALAVNLRAPMVLGRRLAEKMVERHSGHLVFMSSLAGKAAPPGSSVYSATKFGLRGFGYSLSEELRGSGVGATTVFPGFIREAGMFAESGAKLPRFAGTRTPEQVASAVLEGIDKNRAEIDVAPLSFSSGAKLFGLSPSVMSRISRALGADGVSDQLEVGQRDKR